jgi:hypothetical protein
MYALPKPPVSPHEPGRERVSAGKSRTKQNQETKKLSRKRLSIMEGYRNDDKDY